VLAGADEGDAIGAGIGLLLEQLVQQLGPQQVRVGREVDERANAQTISR
jgi:hypothetical protein